MMRAGAGDVIVKGLAEVLSEFSGLPPSDHEIDAFLLFAASELGIDKPKEQIERAKRLYKAANDIERAMSAMSAKESHYLLMNFVGKWRTPLSSSPQSYDNDSIAKSADEPATDDAKTEQLGLEIAEANNAVPAFVRALKYAAKKSEKISTDFLKLHDPKSKNVNLANLQVALLVSDIYVEFAKREPPKAGTNGPFQRLLHEVYKALGRLVDDVRGPLRMVHEYRKNRHSCS